MSFQKFDLVQIAADQSFGFSFTKDGPKPMLSEYAGLQGIVQHASDDGGSYCLLLRDHGQVSWFMERELSLVGHGRQDLDAEWRNWQEARNAL